MNAEILVAELGGTEQDIDRLKGIKSFWTHIENSQDKPSCESMVKSALYNLNKQPDKPVNMNPEYQQHCRAIDKLEGFIMRSRIVNGEIYIGESHDTLPCMTTLELKSFVNPDGMSVCKSSFQELYVKRFRGMQNLLSEDIQERKGN